MPTLYVLIVVFQIAGYHVTAAEAYPTLSKCLVAERQVQGFWFLGPILPGPACFRDAG